MQLSENHLTTAENKKSNNIDRENTSKTSSAHITSDAQSLKEDCLEVVDQLHDDSINFQKSISTEELYDSIETDNYNNIRNVVSNASDKLKTENPKELNQSKLRPNQISSRKIVNDTKERADSDQVEGCTEAISVRRNIEQSNLDSSKVNEEGTNNLNEKLSEVASAGSLLNTVSSLKLVDQTSKSDLNDWLNSKKRKNSIQ